MKNRMQLLLIYTGRICYLCVVLGALLLSVAPDIAFARAKAQKSKPKLHQAIVEARQSIGERNRPEALNIILKAIQTETNQQKSTELKNELNQLATLFFTDEAQKAYELANAIMFAGQNNFISKYNEALKLEPGHWEVMIHMAVGQLKMKNCQSALEYANQAQAVQPYRTEAAFLALRAKMCLSEDVALTDIENISFKPEDSILKQVLLAQFGLKNSQSELVQSAVEALVKADQDFSQSYYVLWQMNQENQTQALLPAVKYVEICKSVTPALRRKYYLQHDLCADVDAVEKYIERIKSQHDED
jgi:hypothetical protein